MAALLLGFTESERCKCCGQQLHGLALVTEYRMCYAGVEKLAEAVLNGGDSFRDGHAVVVERGSSDERLLRCGWAKTGRCWICPEHSGAKTT